MIKSFRRCAFILANEPAFLRIIYKYGNTTLQFAVSFLVYTWEVEFADLLLVLHIFWKIFPKQNGFGAL